MWKSLKVISFRLRQTCRESKARQKVQHLCCPACDIPETLTGHQDLQEGPSYGVLWGCGCKPQQNFSCLMYSNVAFRVKRGTIVSGTSRPLHRPGHEMHIRAGSKNFDSIERKNAVKRAYSNSLESRADVNLPSKDSVNSPASLQRLTIFNCEEEIGHNKSNLEEPPLDQVPPIENQSTTPSENVRVDKGKGNTAKTEGQGAVPSWNLSRLLDDMFAFVTPREKGDTRDVILVCLSFAVLVYISQRLVGAYLTFSNMLKHMS